MKAKLMVIGLAMALGAWMAIGDSPRVRSMEQRVSELEQMVGQLNQVVASQQEQLNSHQQEIDRFAPLTEVMQVYTWANGEKTVNSKVGMWVQQGGMQIDDWLNVNGNIYYSGILVPF